MRDAINYRCPECGSGEHLYMRADIRWNAAAQSWQHVDGSEEDYSVDCTECDWQGPLAACEDPNGGLGETCRNGKPWAECQCC